MQESQQINPQKRKTCLRRTKSFKSDDNYKPLKCIYANILVQAITYTHALHINSSHVRLFAGNEIWVSMLTN